VAQTFGSNKLIESGDMSSHIVSDNISLERKGGVLIQCKWTGSPSGVFTVEASVTNNNVDEDWAVIPGSTRVVKGAGQVFYDIPKNAYAYVRLRYRALSGSGSLDVNFNTKELH